MTIVALTKLLKCRVRVMRHFPCRENICQLSNRYKPDDHRAAVAIAGVAVTRVLRHILMKVSASSLLLVNPLIGRMLKLNLRGNRQRSAFHAASRFTVQVENSARVNFDGHGVSDWYLLHLSLLTCRLPCESGRAAP